MLIITEINAHNSNHFCSICGKSKKKVFLKRSNVPVHQNLLYNSYKEARNCVRGDIELAFCSYCGFISNSKFNPDLLNYSADYENTQTYSGYFYDYLNNLVHYLTEKYDLIGKQIFEIGCGKGDFLKLICEKNRNKGIGFDPSYIGPEQTPDGSVRFIKEFFNDEKAKSFSNIDFIACRHVLEHIENPLELLLTIKRSLNMKKNTAIFLEVPNVKWILTNFVFWDIFYEHYSYFTPNSLKYAILKAGLEVTKTSTAFSDQYLWIEAKPMKNKDQDIELHSLHDNEISSEINAFVKNYNNQIEKCKKLIICMNETEKSAVWGAGAKGVTLLNILDPNAELIDAAIDINPNKQGKFIAGTGHLIISPKEIKNKNYKKILNLNPNYLNENNELLRKMSVDIQLSTL